MSKSQPGDSTEAEQAPADTTAAGKEEEDESLTAADELAPLQVVCITYSHRLPSLLSLLPLLLLLLLLSVYLLLLLPLPLLWLPFVNDVLTT